MWSRLAIRREMPKWPVGLLSVGSPDSSSTSVVLLENEYPESFQTRTEKILSLSTVGQIDCWRKLGLRWPVEAHSLCS
jgi:hypothetical protein